MSLTERQFNYLTSMGIGLWQPRVGVFNKDNISIAQRSSIKSAQSEQPVAKVKTEVGVPTESKQSAALQTKANTSDKSARVDTHKLDLFQQSTLFSDIINCLQVDLKDIKVSDNTLVIGQLNWAMSEKQAVINAGIQHVDIQLSQQQLTTPNWQELANSPKLKQQFWQVLSQYIDAQT